LKVTNVRMETYRWKRKRPIRNGRYVYPHTGLNVIIIETDEGVSGIGLGGNALEAEDICRSITEYLKMYVIDQNPLDNERIWYDMWQPKLVGTRGLTTRIISGIDIALWDIKGKVSNLPLYKLLGGFTDKVPFYIAGGYYEEGKGLDDLAAEMQASADMGTEAVKMKIGGAPINEDVERVRVVRETLGPRVKIMVDANCAYRYYEAIEIARKIEKYDIYWFEEPVNPDDHKGYELVSRNTAIPVATGENEYTRYGFREFIENRYAAILQPDASIMGGVTEYMKVAAMAQSHDLPISSHGKQEIHVHLVAAIPNGLSVEYFTDTFDPMWKDMFRETLTVDKGFLHPPDRPGVGIELNEEALAPYRVA